MPLRFQTDSLPILALLLLVRYPIIVSISTHRVNGTIEYHAILARDPDQYQIVRCNDGDGPNEEYRAACLLADACGVDLEDG